MILTVLLPLLLLGSVSADRLRFHLENLIDRNISACDDFYHHACSQYVDPEEFFQKRVSEIFNTTTEMFNGVSDMHSPIAFELQQAEFLEALKLEDNNYEHYARERCKTNISCYDEDITEVYPNYTSVQSNESPEETIQNYIIETSAMIDALIVSMNTSFITFKEQAAMVNFSDPPPIAIRFHTSLQSRIHVIEFMKSNNSHSDFQEIKEISEKMKDRIIKNIEQSWWLNIDEVGIRIVNIIKERIESIQVYHDFDELDKNITTLRKLNRDLISHYFAVSKRSGVHGLDTILGLKDAFERLKSESSQEILSFIDRILINFEFGAFFDSQIKMVTIMAPLMYNPAFCSEILKEPIITYYVLGHEMFHSLFSPFTPTLLQLYGHRAKCIAEHYNKTCDKFAIGACRSGVQTITEDAPDLESTRLMHSLLLEEYTTQELAAPIEGMETTLEQAFFYYATSAWCAQDEPRTEVDAWTDPHSAKNIRINGVFSLMPEFTKAFSCKAGDPMFVEERTSCYVFGPNS
ncbi:hypothetical protein PRIPAC_95224 [Pristionchus pacificus]|uniref:Peptidase n=1 Tax=Pristionchus pacificus TaxID=54126 RepID=A0A2A6BJZ4_PRIPA|nr:hypothetical protein PRIPAC_95224 [Pristionchus pacificus]|eukprot:PDM66219.1 Peptidase [Pristionchus pacificus]